MTIRAGQVLHVVGNRFQAKSVIDRLQNVGPGINIPSEKVYETGNFSAVDEVRDTPELTFAAESVDVSVEFEALLAHVDPAAVGDGTGFNLANSKPIDILAPFKDALNAYNTTRAIAVPYQTLASATYRFGVQQNAVQAFELAGDSIYYIPGSAYQEVFPAAGVGPYSFANPPAIPTTESGVVLYAYCVTLHRSDGTYQRLFAPADYTNTATGFTLTTAAPAGSTLHVVYGSGVIDNYPEAVHQGTAVKPSAVRGSHIDVYVSDGAATPTLLKWDGLQSAELNWRLALEAVRELGNTHIVEQTYDVPDLTGTLTMRPKSVAYMFDRVGQVTGVATTETINALSSVALDTHVRIRHPITGVVLKTFVAEKCRFTPPAGQVQANTRLDVPWPFTSATGKLTVYKGTAPF